MKTICVFATIEIAGEEMKVMEHSEFGLDHDHYTTAHDFISYCESMWKKHAEWFRITNVVIG